MNAYHSKLIEKEILPGKENRMEEFLLNFNGDEEDDYNPIEEVLIQHANNIKQDPVFFDEINQFALNNKKSYALQY